MKACEAIPVTLKQRDELMLAAIVVDVRIDPIALARWEGEGGAIITEFVSRGPGGNR